MDKCIKYIERAIKIRSKANCRGNRVGALIVLDDVILSEGYNSTVSGVDECEDGGCPRCSNREKFLPGKGYELCLCIHAEQAAILNAARRGIAIEGSAIYTTMRPCIGCAKELLQVGIRKIVYLHEWYYENQELNRAYNNLLRSFQDGIYQVEIDDKDAIWAVSRLRERNRRSTYCDELGHSIDVENQY